MKRSEGEQSINFSPFHRMLQEFAERFPDKIFIQSVDQNKSITYGQIYQVCNQIGHFFKAKGLKANDRVVLLSENSLENLILFIGVLSYGATYCPLNMEVTEKMAGELIDKIQPRLILQAEGIDSAQLYDAAPGEFIRFSEWESGTGRKAQDGDFFSKVAGCPDTPPELPSSKRGDFCIVVHTSGTTAKPKGVIHTYGAIVDQAEALALALGISSADRILEYRPFSWGSAQLLGFIMPLTVGATVVVARKFSQSRFFDWIRDYRISVAASVPTTINMLLSRPLPVKGSDFPDLRYITSSSAPLTVSQHLEFEQRYGIKIIQMYGMSEAGWVAANLPEFRKIGTVGRPLKYQEVRILGSGPDPLPAEMVGEIEVGGNQRFYGYLEEGSRVAPYGDKRLKTGDIGFLDKEGFLHITGRMKDLIIRGGVNIAPAEIDNVLMQHPDVMEAATVGVPNRVYGEEVVCYLALKEAASSTPESLLNYCRQKLPEFKIPKEIIFAPSIPKNNTGKIDRKMLVEDWKRNHNA